MSGNSCRDAVPLQSVETKGYSEGAARLEEVRVGKISKSTLKYQIAGGLGQGVGGSASPKSFW